MKDLLKTILSGGLIILFFAFAFGDNALSYEDIEISRGLIITQNGNDFSVTDKNRHAVGGSFTDIEATPYVVSAAVNTRGKLKQALSTYIDDHIGVMTTAIPPKLMLLAMDSALYTYHQQGITVNGNGYHLSYSMLMQKNGDYVILEERLIPEKPIFLAAHYIARNTGIGHVPTVVQFSQRDRLIMEGADEQGNNARIFPAQMVRVTLPDSTLTITTHNKAVAITAYPAKSGTVRSIPRDLHKCVAGIPNPKHVATILNTPNKSYTLTSGALEISKAYCLSGTSLKKLVEEEPDLGSVVGIIYGVIENLTSKPISVTVTGRNNYAAGCDIRADTQWNIAFLPQANIIYYWIDPDTWEMQFLRTKKLERNVNSHLSAAREAPDRGTLTVTVNAVAEISMLNEVVLFPDMGDLLNRAFHNNNTPIVISGVVAPVIDYSVTTAAGDNIIVNTGKLPTTSPNNGCQ